ncbi:MAG: hypothetical protein M1826_006617 [Phylliscum demangeonii]|nr:MAG: hypothetical protein M1826_006617 [Phylliscum demangeonii]
MRWVHLFRRGTSRPEDRHEPPKQLQPESLPTPPTKLTKPMTNRSSSNLLLPRLVVRDLDGARSEKTPFDVLPRTPKDEGGAMLGPDGRSRPDAPPRRKSRLGTSRAHTHGVDDSPSEGLGAIISGLRDRLSRTGSMVSHPSSAPDSITAVHAGGLDDARRLGVPEPSPDDVSPVTYAGASVEGGAPLTRGLSSSRLSLLPWTSPKPDMSTLAMRRRSMFTPGVATRTRSSGAPLHDPSCVQPWSWTGAPAPSVHSPKAMRWPPAVLAAADLTEDYQRRASTPNDLEYSHLGCYVRGSLHVTNGAASPAPSNRIPALRHQSSEDVTSRAERTMVEGSGPAPLAAAALVESGHDALPEEGAVQREVLGDRAEELAPALERDGRLFDTVIPAAGLEMGPSMDFHFDPAEPTTTERGAVLNGTPIASLAEHGLAAPSDPITSIAEEYIYELDAGPYSTGQPPRKTGWTRLILVPESDEPAGFDDEGFGSSSSQSDNRLSGNEDMTPSDGTGSRRNSAQLLSTKIENWPFKDPSHLQSSAGSRSSSSGQDGGDSRPDVKTAKPLGNADSGYSSTLSLWSFQNERWMDTGYDGVLPRTRQASSVYSTGMIGDATRVPLPPLRIPPPPPPKPLASSFAANGLQTSSPTTKSPSLSPVVTRMSMSLVETAPAVPLKYEGRPQSRSGVDGLKPVLPRKLTKGVPASVAPKSPITVQGQQVAPEAQVPPVPSEVVSRHADRLKQHPFLGHADSVTLHSPPSASDSSGETVLATVTFPGTEDPRRDKKAKKEREKKQKREKEELEKKAKKDEKNRDRQEKIGKKEGKKEGETTAASARGRQPSTKEERRSSMSFLSRSLRRPKSEPRLRTPSPPTPISQSEADFVSNFDDVMGSLGDGPYAVASAEPSTRRRPVSGEMSPHRLSRAFNNSKSMVGLNSAAASALARERSRDRARLASNRAGSLDGRQPHEYSASEPDDGVGSRIRRLSRPGGSLLDDAPPIPSLPAVHGREVPATMRSTSQVLPRLSAASKSTPDLSDLSGRASLQSSPTPAKASSPPSTASPKSPPGLIRHTHAAAFRSSSNLGGGGAGSGSNSSSSSSSSGSGNDSKMPDRFHAASRSTPNLLLTDQPADDERSSPFPFPSTSTSAGPAASRSTPNLLSRLPAGHQLATSFPNVGFGGVGVGSEPAGWRAAGRRARRKTPSEEVLRLYHGGSPSHRIHPILENAGLQESRAVSSGVPILGRPTSVLPPSSRRYSELLKTHGLDLSDVPLFVSA